MMKKTIAISILFAWTLAFLHVHPEEEGELHANHSPCASCAVVQGRHWALPVSPSPILNHFLLTSVNAPPRAAVLSRTPRREPFGSRSPPN